MSKIIVGNWKMNGSKALVQDFAQNLKEASLSSVAVICPSFPMIAIAREAWPSEVALGAQDCSPLPQGAHTGDVSALQLRDAGAAYVILGHSERRQEHNETPELIASKIEAALATGLTPIVCIGESEAIYEAHQTVSFLKDQIRSFATLLERAKAEARPFYIAYEPLWAIGTGRLPSLEEIEQIHAALFEEIGLAPLYGGSVKLENFEPILKLEHVGGLLVGGESLKTEKFVSMLSR